MLNRGESTYKHETLLAMAVLTDTISVKTIPKHDDIHMGGGSEKQK